MDSVLAETEKGHTLDEKLMSDHAEKDVAHNGSAEFSLTRLEDLA